MAEFKALKAVHGNGSAAARILTPTLNPSMRAFHVSKKLKASTATEFIDEKLQQIGIDSIQRIGLLVNSTDENVATRNAHFVVEQIRGKATQKSIALTGKLKAQDVLA